MSNNQTPEVLEEDMKLRDKLKETESGLQSKLTELMKSNAVSVKTYVNKKLEDISVVSETDMVLIKEKIELLKELDDEDKLKDKGFSKNIFENTKTVKGLQRELEAMKKIVSGLNTTNDSLKENLIQDANLDIIKLSRAFDMGLNN